MSEHPEGLEGQGTEAEPDPAAEGFVGTLPGLSRDDLERLVAASPPAEAEAIRAELDRRASRLPFDDGPTSAQMDTDAWRIRHGPRR